MWMCSELVEHADRIMSFPSLMDGVIELLKGAVLEKGWTWVQQIVEAQHMCIASFDMYRIPL